MAKPRRVFRVFNWSDFPLEVRSGMALQLRNQIPVVVLKRSKEANEALKKESSCDKSLTTVSQRVSPEQAEGNCQKPVLNGTYNAAAVSSSFICDHSVLEDLMFDFLASVERNGGVQVINEISGFKEPDIVRSEVAGVFESNNNDAAAAEEGERSTDEVENRNGDSPGLSDIENVQREVEFVDVSSSSCVTPSAIEEPVSPVLKGKRAARNGKMVKRSRGSSAASRKAPSLAQAKRSAAIKRIYARIVQRNMNSSRSSLAEPSLTRDSSSSCVENESTASPSVESVKRKRRRFSRVRSSKDDDVESEDSEEENDEDSVPSYVP